MRWQHKAQVMKVCASLPMGDRVYKLIQKSFGRLNADPKLRISTSIEMAHWILDQGLNIESKRFFEVGTGHKPIVPIGFFLSGAESVITVDLNRRLDFGLTQQVLAWMAKNRQTLESVYLEIVDSSLFHERFDLIQRLWSAPQYFLKEAGIQYLAPADAADTGLSANSVDYHFSATVLEHIPSGTIKDIFVAFQNRLGLHTRNIGPGLRFSKRESSKPSHPLREILLLLLLSAAYQKRSDPQPVVSQSVSRIGTGFRQFFYYHVAD